MCLEFFLTFQCSRLVEVYGLLSQAVLVKALPFVRKVIPARVLSVLEENAKVLTANDLFEKLSDIMNGWKTRKVKIAFIGYSGAGKSSLINALRGLKAESKEAAAVGLTETTTGPNCYAHPKSENVQFWDLPGQGTTRFPVETYAEKVGLDTYDLFVIVSKSRFSQSDLSLAQTIKRNGKRFFSFGHTLQTI